MKRRIGWITTGAVLVAFALMVAFMPHSASRAPSATKGDTHAITVGSGPIPPISGKLTDGITELGAIRHDNVTGKTTTDLAMRFDVSGRITQCGPCPPGLTTLNGNTVQLAETNYWKFGGKSEPSGNVTLDVYQSHGFHCILLGNCLVDTTIHHYQHWMWGYGAVSNLGTWERYDGCGLPLCIIWGHTVNTPHGHNPQLHYNYGNLTGPYAFVPTSITYEDNYFVGVIPVNYENYARYWPWVVTIAANNGIYAFDASIDCELLCR